MTSASNITILMLTLQYLNSLHQLITLQQWCYRATAKTEFQRWQRACFFGHKVYSRLHDFQSRQIAAPFTIHDFQSTTRHRTQKFWLSAAVCTSHIWSVTGGHTLYSDRDYVIIIHLNDHQLAWDFQKSVGEWKPGLRFCSDTQH